MILHLYIARRFLRSFAIVLGVFISILLPIDLAEQLRRIGNPEAGLNAAFQLALLNLPGTLYEMLPLFIMIATLFLFLGLARTSELVVVRAAGRSALRSTMSPVVVAVLLGVLGVTVLNPIVAATERQYSQSIARFQTGEERTLSVSAEGLWLRQGSEARQTVIRADRSNADGTVLSNASFFVFDDQGTMQRRIDAGSAQLELGAWSLENVKIWPLAGSANPEAEAETLAAHTLPSTLTREQIRDSFGSPTTVPIYELPGFIRQLNRAGFAALQHRVWLQMELSNPLMLAAMVLIAAGFTMRHTRFGKTGVMVLSAILLGFGVFFIRSFAQVLGETGQLPISVVAWTPPLAAILLALGLLLHTEDG
ncbi:LPS export ABC transporter permease LptG [Rhodophyticola porphyridii]|uniref:LPS export ABC transporter permease LptG n=1 Tax=Rhodophyticola porphyridii TaxID=1852017 RepID=A0A3L9Y6J6_9RHOB|nr:LPS export ABC transporter permease LptG [Rhodophyticola porphyridii]RMA41736.1 LPS export ABC transporter permease LptG [Rhodophyticola porphyridii]